MHYNYNPEEFKKVVNHYYISEDKNSDKLAKELKLSITIYHKYVNTHLKQKIL